MSFKGVVTRKDKEAGVDLLAKIVTENNKKSAKKTFTVHVASNGLSDTESCSRAVIIKKEEITKAGPGGADDLTVSINLNALGAFGTTLSYEIVNDNPECPLTDYLSNNGTLIGSPIYGSGDATGKLYITASKNDASITAIVPITIKAYTSESIMYDTTIVNKSAFWRAMTANPEYTLSNNKITFLSTWEPWKYLPIKPSNQPVQVTYTIEDKISDSIDQARITDTTPGLKEVYRPAYSILMPLIGTSTEFSVTEDKDTTQAGPTSKGLKCNGLILHVSLVLGDTQITYDYDVTTRGAALTNEEIITAIEGLVDAESPKGNKSSQILKLYNADTLTEIGSYFMNATAPSDRTPPECFSIDCSDPNIGTAFNIKCLTSTDFETIVELPSLGLTFGNISAEISEPQVFAYNGLDEYCNDPIITNNVFAAKEGVSLAEFVIPVNLDIIKTTIDSTPSLETNATGFAIFQKISCTKYGGNPKELRLMKWFAIKNIDSVSIPA